MWLVEDGLCLFLFVPAAVDFVPLVASTCFVVFCVWHSAKLLDDTNKVFLELADAASIRVHMLLHLSSG